jgi:hypothetical protein
MMFAWSPGVLGYACEWLTPRAHRVQAVEGKERDLRERGAAWDPPSVSTMLRSLPFLADTSETLFEEVMLQGHMVKYQKGAVIAPAGGKAASHSEPPFVGVILSGLAATTVAPYTVLSQGLHGGPSCPERLEENSTAFLTRGSVFGILGTLTGHSMPGRGAIVAHSDTSATHVFQMPKKVFDEARSPCSTPGCLVTAAPSIRHRRMHAGRGACGRRRRQLQEAHAEPVPPGSDPDSGALPGAVCGGGL